LLQTTRPLNGVLPYPIRAGNAINVNSNIQNNK
jgi:hypothetical protein